MDRVWFQGMFPGNLAGYFEVFQAEKGFLVSIQSGGWIAVDGLSARSSDAAPYQTIHQAIDAGKDVTTNLRKQLLRTRNITKNSSCL